MVRIRDVISEVDGSAEMTDKKSSSACSVGIAQQLVAMPKANADRQRIVVIRKCVDPQNMSVTVVGQDAETKVSMRYTCLDGRLVSNNHGLEQKRFVAMLSQGVFTGGFLAALCANPDSDDMKALCTAGCDACKRLIKNRGEMIYNEFHVGRLHDRDELDSVLLEHKVPEMQPGIILSDPQPEMEMQSKWTQDDEPSDATKIATYKKSCTTILSYTAECRGRGMSF